MSSVSRGVGGADDDFGAISCVVPCHVTIRNSSRFEVPLAKVTVYMVSRVEVGRSHGGVADVVVAGTVDASLSSSSSKKRGGSGTIIGHQRRHPVASVVWGPILPQSSFSRVVPIRCDMVGSPCTTGGGREGTRKRKRKRKRERGK